MKIKATYILLMNIVALTTTSAEALELLMHGSEAQATGGLGIVTTNSSSSLLYNPAALSSLNTAEYFAEAGFLSLRYSYTFPEFDPAVIKVNTPFVFTGFSYPLTDWLTFGSSFFPVPGGAGPGLKIEHVPTRQLSQEPGLIDVLTENTSPLDYKTSAGLSVTNRAWFSIGVSYVREKQELKTTITDSASGDDIFSMKTKSLAESGLLGLNLRPGNTMKFGATYQTLTRTHLGGTFLNEGGESFSVKAHKGRRFGVGALITMFSLSSWVEILHRHESENSGSTSPFSAANPHSAKPESFDANSLSSGISYRFSQKQLLQFSFGWHPTTVGGGFMADDPASEEEIPGIQFGDLDAVSRKVFAAGYRQASKSLLLKSSFSYQTGSRYVGDSSRGTGQYDLDVFTITAGIGTRF